MLLLSILIAAVGFVALRQAPPNKLFLFRLPGVAAHELAHWTLALVTNSSPSPVRVLWHRESDGTLTYAEVKFTPGTFTAGAVAMAPLLALPWVASALVSAGPLPAVAAGSVLAHGYPSGADWRVLWIRPLSWPLAALLLALSYFEWWNTWILS